MFPIRSVMLRCLVKCRTVTDGSNIGCRVLFSSGAFNGDVVDILPEVKEALGSNKPVVALESTIITHGMPYPTNFETATQVEEIIRKEGAVPATIGIIRGRIQVGMSRDKLEMLAKPPPPERKVIKVSRRDFPFVLSKDLDGGTTVAGTILVADMVGIKVFVTGGVGGVHRGVEHTMDISADLTEMSRSSVTVVSSGVKSILDIGRTLEYLETMGVCVCVYGDTAKFPAFFTRESGHTAPYNVTDCDEAAALIASLHRIKIKSGVLLAVPVPADCEFIDFETLEEMIEESQEESRKCGVKGKNATPFLLNRLNELTKGASLKTNVVLVKNNALIGARVAVKLHQLLGESRSDTEAGTDIPSPSTGI